MADKFGVYSLSHMNRRAEIKHPRGCKIGCAGVDFVQIVLVQAVVLQGFGIGSRDSVQVTSQGSESSKTKRTLNTRGVIDSSKRLHSGLRGESRKVSEQDTLRVPVFLRVFFEGW